MRKRKPTPAESAPPTRVRTLRGQEYVLSEAHPVADCYQWMTEEQIEALAESIRQHGQKDPILRLKDGRIVDGRNRELACRVAGITPRYEACELTTAADIIARIHVANDQRRHSSESQRAMTAARLSNLERGSNQHARQVDGSQEPSTTLEQLAKVFRVSRSLIKRAKIVLRRGTQALAEVVDAGRLDVTNAARVAILDPDVRDAIATAPDPKASLFWARIAHVQPSEPSPGCPLVPDGDAYIRVTPDTPTVGAVRIDEEHTLPGIPRPLADERVWEGWYIDIRHGHRTAYLVPTPGGEWFVVVTNISPPEWYSNTRPFSACRTMSLLMDGYDFDVYWAGWRPSARFAPSAINPLYLDPDYAPTLQEDFKKCVEFEKSLEERRQAREALEANNADDSEIPF